MAVMDPYIESDCVIIEKVFDQCFKEDVITRQVDIPVGTGEACEGVDLSLVDRVDCEIVSADCEVVAVGDVLPGTDNLRIVTVRQIFEIEISLIDETPGGDVTLCTFTNAVDNFYNDFVLYVPTPGVLFGPVGGPFIECHIVGALCYCRLNETFADELALICTTKLCKIIEVSAFTKVQIPVNGPCEIPPCEAAPQEEELVCPPEDLFPPQPI